VCVRPPRQGWLCGHSALLSGRKPHPHGTAIRCSRPTHTLHCPAPARPQDTPGGKDCRVSFVPGWDFGRLIMYAYVREAACTFAGPEDPVDPQALLAGLEPALPV